MLHIYYTYFQSPFGKIYIAHTNKGICALSLNTDEEEFTNRLSKRVNSKDSYFQFKPDCLKELCNELDKYFSGLPTKFDYKLDLTNHPEFYQRVWLFEKENIPYGKTMSYKEVAMSFLGNQNATRAVAQANANNPVALIIPCHRVICSNGSLGGFSAGIEIKKRLLQLEKIL